MLQLVLQLTGWAQVVVGQQVFTGAHAVVHGVGAEQVEQESQQSERCSFFKCPRRRWPQVSVQHGSLQLELHALPQAALGAATGASAPVASQAVVIKRKAAFTRIPPYGVYEAQRAAKRIESTPIALRLARRTLVSELT